MGTGASRGRLEPAAGRCQNPWSGRPAREKRGGNRSATERTPPGRPAREKRGEGCGGKDALGRFLAGVTAPTGGGLN